MRGTHEWGEALLVIVLTWKEDRYVHDIYSYVQAVLYDFVLVNHVNTEIAKGHCLYIKKIVSFFCSRVLDTYNSWFWMQMLISTLC